MSQVHHGLHHADLLSAPVVHVPQSNIDGALSLYLAPHPPPHTILKRKCFSISRMEGEHTVCIQDHGLISRERQDLYLIAAGSHSRLPTGKTARLSCRWKAVPLGPLHIETEGFCTLVFPFGK